MQSQIRSKTGQVALGYNADGNLVFYNTSTMAAILTISRTVIDADVAFKAPSITTEGE